MLDAGYWMLDAGCWILDTGCLMLDPGYLMLDHCPQQSKRHSDPSTAGPESVGGLPECWRLKPET